MDIYELQELRLLLYVLFRETEENDLVYKLMDVDDAMIRLGIDDPGEIDEDCRVDTENSFCYNA